MCMHMHMHIKERMCNVAGCRLKLLGFKLALGLL